MNNYQIISTDGTSISASSLKQYGWRNQGKRLFVTQSVKRMHYLSSFTLNGFLYVKSFDKSPKRLGAVEYYDELIQKFTNKTNRSKVVIIMDNASILHTREMKELCKFSKVIFLYSPSNSPFLNPIEFTFEMIKKEIRSKTPFNM